MKGWLYTGNSTRVEWWQDGTTHYIEPDGREIIVYQDEEGDEK